MSKKQDLAFHLGESWEIDATCLDADGVPFTIISAEWRLASKATLLVKVTTSNNIAITGTGTCKITIDQSLQTSLVPGNYSHELFVVGPDSDTTSIQVVGTFTIANTLLHQFP